MKVRFLATHPLLFSEQNPLNLKIYSFSLIICQGQLVGNNDTNVNDDEIIGTIIKILSLFFLALGTYPRLCYVRIDDRNLDISKLAHKYISDFSFNSVECKICTTDSSSINEKIYEKMQAMQIECFEAMKYLVSEAYKGVLFTDKLVLLSHAAEGFYIKKHGDDKTHLNKRLASVLQIFQTYDEKSDSRILKEFGWETIDPLSKKIADTRNWYSHYLLEDSRKNPDREGKEFVAHFLILYFALRLYIANEIGMKLDGRMIKKYLLRLHDWTKDNYHFDNEPYLSWTYQLNEARRKMEHISEEAHENG